MNSANLRGKSEEKSTEKIKLLVFAIGSLNVSLSVDVVEKVVNYSHVFGSGLNHYGLVNLGDEEITVIDLHKKLFNTPQNMSEEDKKYLLLAKNSVGETFGILINQTPELYDIGVDIIRTLPPSYRRADTLKIASHVFILQGETQQETVFILDPDELITPVTQ